MADTAGDLTCGEREGGERIQFGEEEVEESNDVVEEERSAISSAFLVELNLVMMVAFLTLSGDEFLRSEEDPEKIVAGEDQHVREVASKLKRRRHRQPDDYKAAVSRSQTKILDSRHGRKM